MADIPIKDVGLGTLVDDQDVLDNKLKAVFKSLRAARGEIRSGSRKAAGSAGDAVRAAMDLRTMIKKARARAKNVEGDIKDLNKQMTSLNQKLDGKKKRKNP